MRFRNITILTAVSVAAAVLSGCNPMDLKSETKVSVEDMLSIPDGVNVVMANLYGRLPIEDFGFNPLGYGRGGVNDNGFHLDQMTDNATNSQAINRFPQGSLKNTYFKYWEDGWKLNRDINYLISIVPSVTALSEDEKSGIVAECHFLRAFNYFEMTKRYGGLPIIKEYVAYSSDTDIATLKIQRSTEEATYDFILDDCDAAASALPEARPASSLRRVTKYAVLAFKSRVALFAASVANYNRELRFEGTAANAKMIGMSGGDVASKYYSICEEAAETVIRSGKYALYKSDPHSPEDAMANITAYFQNPSLGSESIILKGYRGTANSGHSIDFWYGPNQTADGAAHPGRMNPSLSYADCCESYDNPGADAPVYNTTDGNYTRREAFNSSRTNYIHHAEISDFYKNKDVRFLASVVIPDEVWKGTRIAIQAGFVRPDGSSSIKGANEEYTYKGVTYYTYGAQNWENYSGFQVSQGGRMTRTGLGFKKWLSSSSVPNNDSYGNSFQDWAELRYAEVLLNYAEAVVENNADDATKSELAEDCLNATRFRAGHTVRIPLTIENVRRERRVEFAFENKRWWDMLRTRTTHKVMDHYACGALSPVLDLRTDPPSYILVRENIQAVQTFTFSDNQYYLAIPNTGSNGLVQNPSY